MLLGLSRRGGRRSGRSQSVDLNPLIVVDGVPVAVDALVEVRSLSSPVDAGHFRALFDPRGVIVAGA